ncbi:hypothetical protein BDV95DRAFT_669168 [Massariosphaeria phaeospora]|uniref:Uncharacterized protein n=1 Tax=Massariosphaeria phaeospora TaxID=100035 RepID=A0A7C8M4P4_9PLEO|nr:hypothetical protein BDV95DRAFT_669168 [Massariosphaeria phaeospora]
MATPPFLPHDYQTFTDLLDPPYDYQNDGVTFIDLPGPAYDHQNHGLTFTDLPGPLDDYQNYGITFTDLLGPSRDLESIYLEGFGQYATAAPDEVDNANANAKVAAAHDVDMTPEESPERLPTVTEAVMEVRKTLSAVPPSDPDDAHLDPAMLPRLLERFTFAEFAHAVKGPKESDSASYQELDRIVRPPLTQSATQSDALAAALDDLSLHARTVRAARDERPLPEAYAFRLFQMTNAERRPEILDALRGAKRLHTMSRRRGLDLRRERVGGRGVIRVTKRERSKTELDKIKRRTRGE